MDEKVQVNLEYIKQTLENFTNSKLFEERKMKEEEFKVGDVVRCGSFPKDMTICSINPKNKTAILKYFIEDQLYEEINPLSTLKHAPETRLGFIAQEVSESNIYNSPQYLIKELLPKLADAVFEKAHMNLTRWKAEELRELVLNFKIEEDSNNE